jgi:hypothetical protein
MSGADQCSAQSAAPAAIAPTPMVSAAPVMPPTPTPLAPTPLVSDDISAMIRSSATRTLSRTAVEIDRKTSVDALTKSAIMPSSTTVKWTPPERFRKRLTYSGSVYGHDQVRYTKPTTITI